MADIKITDRRGLRTSTGIVVARGAAEVRRELGLERQAQDALHRGAGGAEPADDETMRQMRVARARGGRSLRRLAGMGSATSVSFATPRPRDPMFYWRDSGLPTELTDPKDLAVIREWCRFMYRSDPVLGSAIDIFSKYPTLGAQFKCKDQKLVEFYSTLMFDQLDYEEYLTRIGREYWTVGEAWPLGSWNDLLGVWEADELIHPDDVVVERSPFLHEPRFYLKLPEKLRDTLRSKQPKWEYDALVRSYPELLNFMGIDDQMPVSGVLLKQVRYDGDTFNSRGVPLLLRALRPAIQEEMLNAAQDSIAERLYTPLILARIGASASDLGMQRPWFPSETDIGNFEAALDAALAADFRVLTTHFATQMESVFGREVMPNFDADFERLTMRKLQVFGLSETALSGASSGETYAADAINRDLVTQLLTTFQRYLRKFVRARMLVVAEAQGHYDYETRGGKRYVINEEVLVVDDDGNQAIEERPKLLVPDTVMAPMNMRDEDSRRQFLEALRATGVPLSMRTRLVGVPIDLDDEIEASREEAVQTAVEEQQTRKEIYVQLKTQGLPIPSDLRADFDPHPIGMPAQTVDPATGLPVDAAPTRPPQLGVEPTDVPTLAPTVQDMMTPPGAPTSAPLGPAGEMAQVVPLSRNRARPPESDEMRAGMPTAGALTDCASVRSSLIEGPRHVGMRWAPPMQGLLVDEDDAEVG